MGVGTGTSELIHWGILSNSWLVYVDEDVVRGERYIFDCLIGGMSSVRSVGKWKG